MNKVEKVEKEISDWKAMVCKYKREFCKKGALTSEGTVKGLKIALYIFKESSTSHRQLDKEIMCPTCKNWQKLEVFTYCPDCGTVLYN